MKNAVEKPFNYPASCIAFGQGQGRFRIEKLPPMVQLSSLNAICCADVDGDGTTDLVLGEMSWLSAAVWKAGCQPGHVLLNKGRGRFEWLYPDRSGLQLDGQIRDIVPLKEGMRGFYYSSATMSIRFIPVS